MEEEIITPEEETFDYNKLRYILNDEGYLCNASVGGEILCDLGTCTEYNGDVPSDYETIVEWYNGEIDKLNAWKIVEGHLVYDPNKYKELQTLFKKQEEEYKCATQRYVNDRLKTSSSVVKDELSLETSGNSLLILKDSGNYEIPYLKVESSTADFVNAISSNKNILGIDAITNTINGLEIAINGDGTITLNGTATENVEFDIKGSSTNEDMLFLIQNNTDYVVSGLAPSVSLSLYSFDGTDRTLVNEFANEVINLSSSYVITQVTLNIPSGFIFNNTLIKPQIEVGSVATGFIKHEETKSSAYLTDNEGYLEELISYNGRTIIMIDKDVRTIINYYKEQYLEEKFAEIEVSENEIRSTVSQMNDSIEGQNTKISQITQSVDELNSKITDTANITTSGESEYATVSLINVNESEPISIKVHPINEDIAYLYPNDNLYPSDNTYIKSRILRFTNTETNETFDYFILKDLLYYDENNYDEFILNYDSETCSIIKRVEYIDAEGNKGIKANVETINCKYPHIPLTAGNYTVSLLNYNSGYIYAQLMAANIYTTQFATKVELSSSIRQTKNEINLEVSKKVGNDEVISRINQTSEKITIEASKVNIKGVITSINNDTSTTINGNKITTGSITANQVSSSIITTSNFSAQKINADNITTGTLSADKISGGTISSSSINIGSSTYYLRMGTNWAKNPEVSGLNVGTRGINVNNLGFNSDGKTFTFAGGVKSAYLYCDNDTTVTGTLTAYGSIKTNVINPSGNLNILTGGASGSASNSGVLIRTGAGHINLDASNNGSNISYSVAARGNGLANALVVTNAGSASSKNTKENIIKFKTNDYEDALELLKQIDIYSYDYKYNLYRNKHQYGFIIDEIQKKDNYAKFFDFYESKAKVNGYDLDFAVEEKDENLINVKQYDTNVLDKYLLTCLKAMQSRIEELEEKLNAN